MNYEDVRMRNIENIYTDYNGLVDEITEEAIKNRIKQFQAECKPLLIAINCRIRSLFTKWH